MAIVNATDQSFEVEVKEGVVLADFWAPWCGPCKRLSPILDELSADLGDNLKVVKVNLDENPEIASRFSIMSVPTIIFFKNGEPVERLTGMQSKELLEKTASEYL